MRKNSVQTDFAQGLPGIVTSVAIAPPPRLRWLDPARGVAIIFVLLYHTFGYLNKASSFHGEAGVDAFLLLSGFGLAYSTRAEPWHRFAWRRLKRLLPAYWIVLALCLLDLSAHEGIPPLPQIILHATCFHLIGGSDYAFGISNSFWFIGLIVPLYVWYSLLRPWMVSGRGYGALGISLAIAAIGGTLLLRFCPGWGFPALGHAPHRLPQFFLGAIAGLASARRDPAQRVARDPLLIFGLAALACVVVYFDWSNVPFYVFAGAGIIVLGMLASAIGEGNRFARPLCMALAMLGGIAYELYLCHQYLLTKVIPRALMPKLALWLPKLSRSKRELILAIVSFAVALWVAWGLRWIVAWRSSRASWRLAVRTLLALTAASAGVAAILPRLMPVVRQRTIDLSIEAQPSPAPAGIEPVIYFGTRNGSDVVCLEHDGKGLARFRIDRPGISAALGDWITAGPLVSGIVHVTIDEDFLQIRSEATTLRSLVPPRLPTARPMIGINDLGLKDIELVSRSRITRVAK